VEGSDVVTRDLTGESAKTYKEAVVVLPVPPLVDETVLVVFTYVPMAAAVTLVVIVQLLFAGIEPPVSVIKLPPEVPVIVPPH